MEGSSWTPPYSPYDPTDKQCFAFETVVKRWPVIITGVIDRVYRANHAIHKDPGLTEDQKTAKIEEGKKVIETASKLKYEMAHDRTIERLPEDGQPFVKEYNDALQAFGVRNTWFTAPWLWTECYLYRLIRSWFAQTTLWTTYDPFFDQKCDAFKSSGKAVFRLAQTMHELESEREALASDEAKLQILFNEMLQICLWGNATDLSLLTNLTHDDIQKLQTVEKAAQAERAKFILRDDSEKAWQALRNVRKPGQTEGRVDIVLDNSGFEVFTDLLFADFLVTYAPWVDKVVFHPKSMPWFVSDVTPQDFSWTLDILSGASDDDDDMEEDDGEGKNEANTKKPDPTEWFGVDVADANEFLAPMVARWRKYVADGTFSLRLDDFWTGFAPYWDLPQPLVDQLNDSSGLVVLKGDLNYRKLTGDVQWPTSTPFEEALGPLPSRLKTPLVSLRGCKADVVVGVTDEEVHRAQTEDSRWRISGRYALVSFASPSAA
ncbi:DUF89 domain-containing protein [Auriculariales sp. MPI-PUGE-AT-0066]|nr:DUF89 domain-containing protein [Auriculariales sp. MPI-PUGE-AT-0066]